MLADLKTFGLRLAPDDFGTGFSSLGHLRQFPADIITIGQGFVTDIGREPTAVKILSAITHLAHALDMAVIAKGIETAEQHEEIAPLGCELAQGIFCSPAMMASAIKSLLHRSGDGPTRLPQVSDG